MIEILFPAKNRLEFTVESLRAMLAHTDWSEVSRLWLYDDSSEDDTLEHFKGVQAEFPCPVQIVHGNFDSPVAIMRDFIPQCGTEIFAKIDNDTMLPPGWLTACLPLIRFCDLLGVEAIHPPAPNGVNRELVVTRYIGGIGLMRKSCFTTLPQVDRRYWGFTRWQEDHGDIRKRWINPALPVFLLDHIPFEPWCSLNRSYIERGWAREWGCYGPREEALWGWWKP